MRKVLILDPSKSMRNTLRERLEYEGYAAEAVDTAEAARKLLTTLRFDLLLTDREVPFDEGLSIPFIVLSADASIDSAIEAVRHGAEDYLTRPIDMNRLLQVVHRTLDEEGESLPTQLSQRTSVRRARRVTSPSTVEAIIGSSPEMVRVRELIAKVAPSEARVLITGENGTGKELVARHLHQASPRASAPFVEVNCAAIPSELIESELFGHERGAFTSAIKQRKGKFELADGGTLFMDEIGDMSLAAQAKVLRALQERKICRVGSDRDIEVNVRVLAATNKDLREEIRRGNFREDLYHRIGVIVIRVPALREHASDIPLLTDHFIHRIAEEYRIEPKKIDREALDALQQKGWSGNIRELRNVVERLIILSEEKITERDISLYC